MEIRDPKAVSAIEAMLQQDTVAWWNGRRQEIDEERHLGSTTHISVADGRGGAASLTTSNGEGSGTVLPGPEYQELLDQLPAHHLFKTTLTLDHRNWTLLVERGWRIDPRVTYLLDDTSDLDGVWSGFSDSTRRAVRKAERRLGVRTESDATNLVPDDTNGVGDVFVSHALAEALRQFHAVVHGQFRNRDEWHHVRGAHARVGALVLAHVDELVRLGDQLERPFEDGFRFADKGDHGAVGVAIGAPTAPRRAVMPRFVHLDQRGAAPNAP